MVRLVAEHVLREPDEGPAIYVPKARAELEPLLALWPHVLALPTSAVLSIDDLLPALVAPLAKLADIGRRGLQRELQLRGAGVPIVRPSLRIPAIGMAGWQPQSLV